MATIGLQISRSNDTRFVRPINSALVFQGRDQIRQSRKKSQKRMENRYTRPLEYLEDFVT